MRNRFPQCQVAVLASLIILSAGCVKQYDDFLPEDTASVADAVADAALDTQPADLPPDKTGPDMEIAAPSDLPDELIPDITELEVLPDIIEQEVGPDLKEIEIIEEVDVGCIPEGEGDEFGDGIDQNCDGMDGIDGDSDGYAVNADGETALADCNDDNPDIKPGAEDLVDDDSIDSNCDGMDGIDSDGDGYATEPAEDKAADCNDDNVDIHPGAPDYADGACADTQTTSATEVVDEEGSTGYYSSAAIAADGTMYAAYRTASAPKKVKLAKLAAGSDKWSFFTVHDGGGQYIDLALTEGTVHVSFYDEADSKCLRYAYAAVDAMGAGQWTEITVHDDETAEVGRYSSIVVDDDGIVHIAYWDKTNNNLMYANNTTAKDQFVPETISGDDVVDGEFEKIGQYSSLALDPDGKAHIAAYYETGASLAYITNKSGAWVREIVDEEGWDVGRYSALELDGNGAVHIAYRYSSEEDLRYATNSSGMWKTETVDGLNLKVGSYGSIAIDDDNKVHISYNQGDLDYLRYATNKPGYWVAAKVETEYKCGLQTSLALDAEGTAHIFSTHNDLKKLLHTTATLDCLALGDMSDSNCDGVDGVDEDLDGFASLDSGGGDCDDTDPTIQPNWVTTVLDAGPSVGEFASLTIDAHGKLHASYYAELPKKLMYASLEPDAGEWVIQTADADGQDVGQFSSIATEHLSSSETADGTPAVVHIAYYDNSHGELWYASNGTGAWVPEVVEATPQPGDNVGKYVSIATDGKSSKDQAPHIAYYDETQGLLRHATRVDETWVLSTVPNDGNAGKNTAIDVYNQTVYIAYQAVDSSDLMVAFGAADAWTVEMVDGANADVGEAISIAYDGSNIHVAYRDTNERQLHYALRKGDAWALWTIDADADVGKWTSIALDGNDMVHIAYKDQGTDALMYATNVVVENSLWTKEEVTNEPDSSCGGFTTECGDYVSLRFDPLGRLNAIHYDSINKQLLHSRKSCLGY